MLCFLLVFLVLYETCSAYSGLTISCNSCYSAPCPDQYVQFGNYCYALIYHPVENFMAAESYCNRQNNGHLLNIQTEDEYRFIMNYKPFKTSVIVLNGCPWVGMYYAAGQWQFTDGKQGITRWYPHEPTSWYGKEPCTALCLTPTSTEFTPSLFDVFCAGTKFFLCKSPIFPPPATTPPPKKCGRNAEEKNGVCACKEGFVDILHTDIPASERKHYESGEKCIPLNPCEERSDSMSIMFIIDSSESIGAKNWDKLMDFLDDGADKLPHEANIGFIKFSDEVTSAKWLKSGWTKKTYRKAVPKEYDNGGTNTPVALQKAREMFKKEKSKEKVAVLITDGTPFVDGVEQETVNRETEKAVEKLKDEGVRLVVMGYGTGLTSGMEQIRNWVDEPKWDFFEYRKEASFLKETHMCYLLSKVCRRKVDRRA